MAHSRAQVCSSSGTPAAEPAAIAASGLAVRATPSTDGRQIQVERGIAAMAS